MEKDFSTYNDESYILSQDFDNMEEPLFRRKSFEENDFEIGEDPADAYDIFPRMLDSESKFYPRGWR